MYHGLWATNNNVLQIRADGSRMADVRAQEKRLPSSTGAGASVL
jgi:hypothetical protein